MKNAGILLYRTKAHTTECLLVHPGGPFWAKKDAGAWSIPKGELNKHEDPLVAARREFYEETGIRIIGDAFIALGWTKLKSGKEVMAWALAFDPDISNIKSNTFELEWPPRSGKKILVPEIDKAEWFTPGEAKQKINPAQAVFIDRLLLHLST